MYLHVGHTSHPTYDCTSRHAPLNAASRARAKPLLACMLPARKKHAALAGAEEEPAAYIWPCGTLLFSDVQP